MPGWSELLDEFKGITPENRGQFISDSVSDAVERIAKHYDRNVLYYASAFLQKPRAPGLSTAITLEDINGFMAGVYGCDPEKNLLLILHTPGGRAEAAQTIVEYLRSKFKKIDIVIPTYAMSAGTMIALGCDRILMDRQSQLGPTDPQMFFGGRHYSAHSIVGQFDKAKEEIAHSDPILAHAWAPVLRSLGPALLEEARRTLSYGQAIVQGWLGQYMFAGHRNRAVLASEVADYFSSDKHGAHGKRIGRKDAKAKKVKVINLEADQKLQDEVLTLYHLSTIAFDHSAAVKVVHSSAGGAWIKNLTMVPKAGGAQHP